MVNKDKISKAQGDLFTLETPAEGGQRAGATIIHVEVELSQCWMLKEILPRVTDSILCVIIIIFTIQYDDKNTCYLLSYLCVIPWSSCCRVFTNTLKKKVKAAGYLLFTSTALEKARDVFFNVVVAIWCLFFIPCKDMLPEILGRHNAKLMSKKV